MQLQEYVDCDESIHPKDVRQVRLGQEKSKSQSSLVPKETEFSKSDCGHPVAASRIPIGTTQTPWLSPVDAAKYLNIELSDIILLLKEDRLVARSAIHHGLLFNRNDLDNIPIPLSGADAADVLVQSAQQQETTSNMSQSTENGRADDFMPLQHAAKSLGNIKYKTLLTLVNRGDIPATNIGAKGKRPRWMVSLSLVKAALISQAERETAMRRAPSRINMERFLRSGGKHV